MKSDVIFRIGHDHEVCEDYALKRSDDAIFVSDGCSNGNGPSIFSDWGSRFLCQAASYHLEYMRGSKSPSIENYIQRVISHANSICMAGSINSNCLMSTLVWAYVRNEHVCLGMVGDGIVGVKTRNGLYEFTSLHFSKNMPYYPAYELSNEAKQTYFNDKPEVRNHFYSFYDGPPKEEVNPKLLEKMTSSPSITKWKVKDNPYFNISYPIKHLEFAFIATDGLDSFAEAVDTQEGPTCCAVNLTEVIPQLLNFKRFDDNFLSNRCRWMLDVDRVGTYLGSSRNHLDDLAIGVISFDAKD